jgi:hypothetical protein
MFMKKWCDLNVLWRMTDNDSFGTETCSNVRVSFIKFNSVWCVVLLLYVKIVMKVDDSEYVFNTNPH